MHIKLCVTKQSPTPTPILTKPVRGNGGVQARLIERAVSAPQRWSRVTGSVCLSPSCSSCRVLLALGLTAPASDTPIIRETPIGACVFTITTPPFFLAEKKPEFLKMDSRIRTPIFLVGTFLINKFFLTPNSEFWPVRALGTRPLNK